LNVPSVKFKNRKTPRDQKWRNDQHRQATGMTQILGKRHTLVIGAYGAQLRIFHRSQIRDVKNCDNCTNKHSQLTRYYASQWHCEEGQADKTKHEPIVESNCRFCAQNVTLIVKKATISRCVGGTNRCMTIARTNALIRYKSSIEQILA